MRIHEVVIIPGAGYMTAEGIYTRGHQTEKTTELEVVDRYVKAIEDEFEIGSIRYRTLATRKRPGINEDLRHQGIMPHTLVLHCKIDWNANSPSRRNTNRSRIFYGTEESRSIALLLEETLSHWGTLYVSHEHLCSAPVQDSTDLTINVPDCLGIRLEPYALNGPNADTYFTKLEQMGQDVGRAIADHLIAAASSARMKASTISGSKAR